MSCTDLMPFVDATLQERERVAELAAETCEEHELPADAVTGVRVLQDGDMRDPAVTFKVVRITFAANKLSADRLARFRTMYRVVLPAGDRVARQGAGVDSRGDIGSRELMSREIGSCHATHSEHAAANGRHRRADSAPRHNTSESQCRLQVAHPQNRPSVLTAVTCCRTTLQGNLQ